MPKYLWRISYTSAGVPGLIKDGGSKRRSVVKALVEKAGGVNAAGAARLHTTVLLTPEEIDAATARSVDYRLPGA
jgi:hypothetical protein